jgi:ELWxxDGT repeat protein
MKKILLLFVLIFEVNLSAQILESFPTGTNLQTPSNYIVFNNKMHYFARNASYEILLYATDGTTANNQIVKNFGFSFSTDLNDENEFNDRKIIFNNNLYFSFAGSLYKSDGTTAGTTILLSSIFSVKYFQVYNNRLYFTAISNNLGSELWSTDGTPAGTTLVKDINPGTANAFNYTNYNPHFTVFNNKLFFVANDGVHGFELWSTDGTEVGTSLFKDIRPTDGTDPVGYGGFVGNGGYSKVPFKILGNKMYFGANPSQTNGGLPYYMVNDSFVLYATDGTAAGTNFVQPPLADPVTCSCGNNNYNYFYNLKGMTVYNNKLFFYGNQAFHSFGGIQNGGIYVVDGTNPISRLYAFWDYAGDVGTSDDIERYTMRMYNNEFYFLANTYASGDKTNLWKMNPLNNTFTQMTQTPSSGLTEFSDSGIDLRLLVAKEFNGRLFFVKTRPTEGKIFSTDGTISGTQFEAKSSENANVLSTQAMTVIPNLLFSFGDAIYFKAQFQGASAATLQRLRFTNLSNTVQTTSNFKIYPNPTTTFIQLNFDESLENANLKIVSLVGQTVLEKQNVSGPDFSCDVSNLNAGWYVIQITSGTKQFNTKFIKQ